MIVMMVIMVVMVMTLMLIKNEHFPILRAHTMPSPLTCIIVLN